MPFVLGMPFSFPKIKSNILHINTTVNLIVYFTKCSMDKTFLFVCHQFTCYFSWLIIPLSVSSPLSPQELSTIFSRAEFQAYCPSMAATHNFKIANPSPMCLLVNSTRRCSLICKHPLSANLPNNNVSHFFGPTLSRIHSHQNSIPTLSRRLILTSVSGLWDALTGGNSAREAVIAVRRGMLLFRQVQW